MKRSRLRRGPWRRKKNRPPRPGLTTKPPNNAAWKNLCRCVRLRDGNLCRRCGWAVRVGHTDHIVPRRLCPSPEAADHLDNLAWLCGTCHAFKTGVLEPALYEGDVGAFNEFLRRLGTPLPPVALTRHAFERIAEEMRR